MSSFPNLSNIDGTISNAIKAKANASLYNSGRIPWFRLITLDGPTYENGRGLVIDSINTRESFSSRYGSVNRPGIVGYTNEYKPVNASFAKIGETNDDGKDVFVKDKSIASENRGLRPSPTIESLKIENGTEGLTRKVSFTIKCYTLAQAEIVARHYLDPGSYVLVEFGWNISKSLNQRTGDGKKITTCDLVQYSNLAVLKDKRAASEGTYDAVLAVITGGGMTFGEDETFNIEVKLTSQGELPAYLRSQTGSIISTEQATTGIKYTQGELDAAEDDETGNVGKFLFMQMYNDLPLSKQIGLIKDFEKSTDSNGISWTHPANFLNIDEEVREDLVESLKNVKLRSEDEDKLKVPEDIPLFSDERFIRFELAFEILKTIDYKEVETLCTPTLSNGKKIPITKIKNISIENTLCRAHKHMFSTDKTKLFIPNTNLPDFHLNDFLKNTEAATGSLDPFIQENQNGTIATINAHPNPTPFDGISNDKIFAFPSLNDIEVEIEYDDTILKTDPKAHQYGYLKNLYINYNFFLEVLKKPGLLMHECLMELLNGMSSACNLYWDFQIYEVGDKKDGNLQLEVFDKTFLGLTKRGLKKDGNGIPRVITTSFQSRGIDSPFLDASMDISIAGDMMNQVMMQKEKPAKSEDGESFDPNIAGFVSAETQAQNLKTGLFSYHFDPVARVLSYNSNKSAKAEEDVAAAREDAYKAKENDTHDEQNFWSRAGGAWKATTEGVSKVGSWIGNTATEIYTGDSKEESDIRKSNFKYLSERAGVFPKVNDRNEDYDVANEWYDLWGGNNANLEDVVFIGSWNDPNLLKKYELYDLFECDINPNKESTFDSNPVLVPVKFEFTIHGISGLKVGDCFTVRDLPKKYRTKIFQITQINHEVSELWKTTVEAQMRNV